VQNMSVRRSTQMSESLHNEEVGKLKAQIEKLEKERDETITKFQENESLWSEKCDKLMKDNNHLMQMNSSLKDDNKDLLIEIDKALKRSKQIENSL
jgi:chromosome segregation ATPase